MYDSSSEAMACTNELYYRSGPTPEPLGFKEVPLIVETVQRYLDEAFAAGRKEASTHP